MASELNTKLVQRIDQCDSSVSGNDRTIIEPYYNDLIQLNQKSYCLTNNDKEEIQRLSTNLSCTMDYQQYSIVELLIKLKLIYSDLLEDPHNAEETVEEWFSSSDSEHNLLLYELMNAPLDDIRDFLEKQKETLEKYYKGAILHELFYRISHDNHKSKDHLDKLCDFIKNTMTEKYHPLTAINLMTYIQDQYYAEENFKYRHLLQKFDKVKPTAFTLGDFYRTAKINPAFTPDFHKLFENLFHNYCKKFLNACPVEQSTIETTNSHTASIETEHYPRHVHRAFP